MNIQDNGNTALQKHPDKKVRVKLHSSIKKLPVQRSNEIAIGFMCGDDRVESPKMPVSSDAVPSPHYEFPT
jgi:hypothetical protein